MSKDRGNGPLQIRIIRDDKRGAELAKKLERIAEVNGLSVNAVVNMATAAGVAIVETKLREIHAPELEAA